MASTTYLAPGVYVEEVPSAQQPIAGVGTNTVGFLVSCRTSSIIPSRTRTTIPYWHKLLYG